MKILAFTPGLFLLLTSSGFAQSLNVDCGPLPVPASSYGAAAAQPGHWNMLMMPSAPVALLDLAGGASGVTASVSGDCDSYTCAACSTQQCSGFTGFADEAALLGSWMNADCLGVDQVSLTGVATGMYQAHVYGFGCPPKGTAAIQVRSGGAFHPMYTAVGGFHGDLDPFHASTTFFVPPSGPGQTVEISFSASWESGLAGFQLVELEPAGSAACLGDGTGAACPCANSGWPGHGCQNSASIRGAELEAFGSPSLAADTLAMTSTFEPASVTSVLLQGDLVAPVFFGDGLRCAGGNLKRLYVTSATPLGNATAPPHLHYPISVRSAQLGDPLAPGVTRVYQFHYRDSSPTFCPEPQGGTFNISNAVVIDWQG